MHTRIQVNPTWADVGHLLVRMTLLNDAAGTNDEEVREMLFESIDKFDADVASSPLVERFRNMLAFNKSLESLPFGWDSYGAAPPNNVAVRTVDRIIRQAFADKLLPGAVVPAADGGIAVCWDTAVSHAFIEVGNDGAGILAKYQGAEEPRVVELDAQAYEVVDSSIDDIRSFLGY
jgi:hypothetical protein